MPGPLPKSPETRQRRNKKTSRAVLAASPLEQSQLKLPDHPLGDDWLPAVKAAWHSIVNSPMGDQYLVTDLFSVFRWCIFFQQFLTDPKPSTSAEMRMLERELGLTAMARLRLEWQVEITDEAKRKGQNRRGRIEANTRATVIDPREALK